MRVSHEAIYQALFIQGRGALRRELVTCLRTVRGLMAEVPAVGRMGSARTWCQTSRSFRTLALARRDE